MLPVVQTEPTPTPTPSAPERLLEPLGLPVYGEVLILLVGSLIAAKAFEMGSEWLLGTLDPSAGTIREVVIEELHLPLYVSVLSWGVYQSLLLLDSPALWTIESLVLTLLVVLWGRACIRVGNRGLERVKERDRSYEFAPVLKNFWSVTVVVGAFVAVLIIWELDITPLLASAGLLGIILGFAARDAVANFIGGIALYFDDTYKLGDFIVLETGEKGTVVDIGLRSTTLLTRDRVMVTVPNSVLNNAHVVNESAPQRYKRIRIPIRVAYGVDAERVEAVLLEEAREASYVRDTPGPEVRFQEFGDHGIEYELRVFVPHPTREARARHAVNTAVYTRFAEEDIEVPYPQRDVRMRDDPPDPAPDADDGTPLPPDADLPDEVDLPDDAELPEDISTGSDDRRASDDSRPDRPE